MVTDESVKEANLREIAFKDDEEYKLCKQSAINSLLKGIETGEGANQIEIDYLDLPSHLIFVRRQLLVKVYKDRHHCPIGGLARNKGEKDYTALKMTQDFRMKVIQLRYQLFAIQPQPNKDPHFYWVRTE